MLFFARCMLVLLPDPRQFRSLLGVKVFSWRYFSFYEKCEKRVAAWHRAELRKLDPMFQLTEEVLGYADAQIEAERKGIKPFAPDYPQFEFEALPGGFGVRVRQKN
ncbi:MAG: hypothetical protein Q8L30_02375 [bacterium]|nr:hypothetical protein [bacterium]